MIRVEDGTLKCKTQREKYNITVSSFEIDFILAKVGMNEELYQVCYAIKVILAVQWMLQLV